MEKLKSKLILNKDRISTFIQIFLAVVYVIATVKSAVRKSAKKLKRN